MSLVDAYFLFMGSILALLLGAWAGAVVLLISPRARNAVNRFRNQLEVTDD